ncbi:dyslexia-associated protein KIAA0319-like protein homolog isoform X3 [Manis javanica]|uniref:dyslexia-associated protein KIAA0319-like protein homolog isoform X3 n=1 Tax=Manis javanica TaxID=9974 RepID=UPI003C6CF7D9
MEKRPGVKPSPTSWMVPGFCWQSTMKLLKSLYLFYTCFCFSALWLSTDASESRCQQVKTQFGVGLRSGRENHLRLLDGTPSLQSCWAACCQDSACHAFWWLEGMCILADCSRPQSCWAFRTDSSKSMLVFLKKFQTTDDLGFPPEADVPHILGLGWSRASWRRQSPPRAPLRLTVSSSEQQSLIRKLWKRESPSEEIVTSVVTRHSEMNDSKALGDLNTSGSAEVHKAVTISSPLTTVLTAEIPGWSKNVSVQPETSEDPGTTPSTQQVKSPGRIQIATPEPVAPSYSYATPTPQASLQSTSASHPVTKELVVSAGESVQIILPKNEVKLNAYVLQKPPEGETYTYDWQLITHPKDYSGEMEGKHSHLLKLSKLTPGLYEFKVSVDGQNAHGEGYVNVTVQPEPRQNQPPVAIVSPQFQEISLPTTSTVIDGSQSTDDDKIVQYHWEELKGPLREEKISEDTAILKLSKLVPGNYTFSLTVVDSDGASDSTTASLTVNRAVDYPPVANAGPIQVITLPQNSITLFGNQSTDDHGIASYEWSLSPSSKGKVVEMQGVRTPILQLSAMQEGDYTYQLTVTDTIGQQATAQVTVIVQPENNKPPQADAGPDKELILPVDSTTLDGSRSSDDQKIISYLWEKTHTKMVFFVQNEPPHQIFKGHKVAAMLKNELQKQKADFLIFGALEINTVTCQLNCSDHGHCDSFTKRCICDPFWMENFIKVQLTDGESNCEWSVLYVIIASFVIVVALGVLSWTVICCCRRQKGKPKRKSKYKMLDATDQESLELKPTSRAGIKQKGPALSSSLMHSESELDSDDAIFTWPDREKGKLLHGQNGSVPNGQTALKTRSPREEIL